MLLSVLAVAMSLGFLGSCKQDAPAAPEALVTFEVDRLIVPIEIPFGISGSEFKTSAIQWTHVFNSDVFTLVMDNGIDPQFTATGTYDQLASLSIKVPYGTYRVQLMPDNEPSRTDGLLYYGDAEGVVVDSPTETITLIPSFNYALVLLDPSNVASTSISMYESQGYKYFYAKGAFSFTFTTLDDGSVYTFARDNALSGMIYLGRAPVKGIGGIIVDFSGTFTQEEITLFN